MVRFYTEEAEKRLNSPEVQNLKKEFHELTGTGANYHWECFNSIEEYCEYMREGIKKAKEGRSDNNDVAL